MNKFIGNDGREYRLVLLLGEEGHSWEWYEPGGIFCSGWTAETSRAKALLEAEYQLKEKTSKC